MSEEVRCRICSEVDLDVDAADDGAAPVDARLIAPCACHGSLRFIHTACLERWIASRPAHPYSAEEMVRHAREDARAAMPRLPSSSSSAVAVAAAAVDAASLPSAPPASASAIVVVSDNDDGVSPFSSPAYSRDQQAFDDDPIVMSASHAPPALFSPTLSTTSATSDQPLSGHSDIRDVDLDDDRDESLPHRVSSHDDHADPDAAEQPFSCEAALGLCAVRLAPPADDRRYRCEICGARYAIELEEVFECDAMRACGSASMCHMAEILLIVLAVYAVSALGLLTRVRAALSALPDRANESGFIGQSGADALGALLAALAALVAIGAALTVLKVCGKLRSINSNVFIVSAHDGRDAAAAERL